MDPVEPEPTPQVPARPGVGASRGFGNPFAADGRSTPMHPAPADRAGGHAAGGRVSNEAFAQSLVDGLTVSQAQAVKTTEGPLLVLAGPGSGKTRVITRRIAYLISQGVSSWRILAVTFTNKAAGEMRERVMGLLGGPESALARGLTVTTFHSLCVRLLRRYSEMGGLGERGLLKTNFSVYDADDQAKLMKAIITQLDLSTQNFAPRSVLSEISAAKNELIDDARFLQEAADFRQRQVARCYSAYQHALRLANACDFDDLLMLTARMLKDSASVRSEVQSRFRYVLIDEYQDTNRAQFTIASAIAGGGDTGASGGGKPNICVVGDPDQSIYAWRGADITNILQFEQRYPGAALVRLSENFRSRAPVLKVADRLIQHNTQRKHKPLTPTRGPGRVVECVLTRDEHHEARLVLDWLRSRLGESPAHSWKDCAVFYRTNAASRVLEDSFRRANVPYVLVRGTAYYEREEVRNAMAYLRTIANPLDSVSLERIINTPARGISDPTVARFREAVEVGAAPTLIDALRAPGVAPGLNSRAVQAVARFVQQLDAWRTIEHEEAEGFMGSGVEIALADLVERVISESGLRAHYAQEPERLENLDELVSSAREFENDWLTSVGAIDGAVADGAPDPFGADDLAEAFAAMNSPGEARPDEPGAQEESAAADGPPQIARPGVLELLRAFLEKAALVADSDAIDPERGAVTLMTLHAAKGLEYPFVCVVGWEEGMLPHMRSLDGDEKMIEEERRLAFVGITRAMEAVMLTSSTFRTIRGLAERQLPSRFLDELKGTDVTFSDQSDPFAGMGRDRDDDGDMDGDLARFVQGGRGRGPARAAPRHDEYSQLPEDEALARARAKAAAAGSGPGGVTRGGAPVGDDYRPGESVRHPQFGMGTVKSFSGGVNARIVVDFKGVGVKTLVVAYARLTRA
jgi:DNA helicase-2/ATP-dependent DNA helicase PcrA